MIRSDESLVVHLSREIGISGGGNATLSTILKMNQLGFHQALIFQHGSVPNLENLRNFCIKPTLSQKLLRFTEKIIFRNYPIRLENSIVSSGIISMRQKKIKRIVGKLSANRESIVVICHWVNLGFISLKTMLWLSRQKNVTFMVYLHDFWMLQDLMHQPKYGGYSTVPRAPIWSLQGHPNLIQSILQRRSRKLKKLIREKTKFIFSSLELQEYLANSIEYSFINSGLDKKVIPLSLQYLLTSKEPMFQLNFPRNFFLMIGLHEFHDQRKGFERALAGFRVSKNKMNCPLVVVCDLRGMDPNFMRELIKENVFFFNTVNHETVLALLGIARAVILPSEFETFGLTIFEALIRARVVGISANTVQSNLVTNLGLLVIIQDWSLASAWDYIFEYSKQNSSAKAQNHKILTAREVDLDKQLTDLFE